MTVQELLKKIEKYKMKKQDIVCFLDQDTKAFEITALMKTENTKTGEGCLILTSFNFKDITNIVLKGEK